jgi:hypothetical protein
MTLAPRPDFLEHLREALDSDHESDYGCAIALSFRLAAEHIRTKTVRNHISNIFSKLPVADRAQAAIRAREAGLGDPSNRDNAYFYAG